MEKHETKLHELQDMVFGFDTVVYGLSFVGDAFTRCCWPAGKYVMGTNGGFFTVGAGSNEPGNESTPVVGGNLGPFLVRHDPQHKNLFMPWQPTAQDLVAQDWRYVPEAERESYHRPNIVNLSGRIDMSADAKREVLDQFGQPRQKAQVSEHYDLGETDPGAVRPVNPERDELKGPEPAGNERPTDGPTGGMHLDGR